MSSRPATGLSHAGQWACRAAPTAPSMPRSVRARLTSRFVTRAMNSPDWHTIVSRSSAMLL
eukprot:5945561-Lingulodinium_polyedra.AAC.1